MADIVKIKVNYNINGKKHRIIYENPYGLKKVKIPKFDSNPEITFFTDTDEKGKSFTIGYKKLIEYKQYMKLDGKIPVLNAAEKECLNVLEGEYPDGYFTVDGMEFTSDNAPEIHYSDTTEGLLLRLPPLGSEIIDGIDNGGLWSGSDERVLVINTGTFPFEESMTADVSLVFYDYDKEEFLEPRPKAEIVKESNTVYLCSIDIKNFDSYIQDKTRITVTGVFSLSAVYKDETLVSYEMPLTFIINNTDIYDQNNKYLCLDTTSKVSIDFGTSSTCAAVKSNIISMIEMSPDILGQSAYSIYENPTNLMIYRWKELSDKWNNSSVRQPVLRTHNADHSEYCPEIFNFGHDVKNMEVVNQRLFNSVITQLKMIPKMLEDGKQIIVRDYENSEEFSITDGEGEQYSFNPIEFYGYLLGKAINHPNANGNKFYTNYIFSYPVKFSETIRKKIETSLKRGILRSLPEPIENLKNDKGRNVFQVKMKYSEPIACIGAACGSELVLKDDKPVLFGVFDFGGGTADYSFGMYRKGNFLSDGCEEALELFGVDGDESFGGELIISKITYWIIVYNKKEIVEKGIIFERPKDELIEDGFGNLIQNTIGASTNSRIISEKVSRPFFEGNASKVNIEGISGSENGVYSKNDKTGRQDYSGEGVAEIYDLYSVSANEKVTVKLKLNFNYINKKLKELFDEKCYSFSKAMDNAFNLPYSKNRMLEAENTVYEKDKVCILMSGNSSRHPMIRECLGDIFSKNEIHLIGAERKEKSGNRYKITPKTAVAVGALKLEQMNVIEKPDDISLLYVYVERGPEKIEKIINGDKEDDKWKPAGLVKDGTVYIYSSTIDTDDRKNWKTERIEFEEDDDDKRLMCYIRLSKSDRNCIEYIAVPVGFDPNYDKEEYASKAKTMKL